MVHSSSTLENALGQETAAPVRKIAQILEAADIRVNGTRPWDIQIHDKRFYARVLSQGTLGAGEAYMDHWWDVEALDEFCARIHRIGIYSKIGVLGTFLQALKGRLVNLQNMLRARDVARKHYDLGNDIFEAMLGQSLQYSCAYWQGAKTLDEAQDHKLRLICNKLGLKSGMNVLELGGGFGGLAHFMAAEYGCSVVSYNISNEPVRYARNLCAGLPVRFEERDYREAVSESERFDRVVSVGACEHIGHKNLARFIEVAQRNLNPHALFLLHTIGSNDSNTSTDAWFDKYIFSHGLIPSIAQLGRAMEGLWVLEDLQNIGSDYDRTLLSWWQNFNRAWPGLKSKYGERFYRMWKFYLMSSAGAFRARKLQVWQLVLSKGDITSYTPVR